MREGRPTLLVVGVQPLRGLAYLTYLAMREDVWGEIRLADLPELAGGTVSVRGEDLRVHALTREVFDGVGVAMLFLDRDHAARWAPIAVEAGAVVADNSTFFRRDPLVPLVDPDVNGPQLRHRPKGIVANPSGTVLTMIDTLATLHRGWHLTELVVATYQAASASGVPGTDRLYAEVETLAGDRMMGQRTGNVRYAVEDALGTVSPFSGPTAYNVLPWCGEYAGEGWSTVEMSVRDEVRRLLDIPKLPVAVTAVQVPVVNGHSMALHARFGRPIRVDEARQALVEAPDVVVTDDPRQGDFPTPVDATGIDPTFVGRLRQSLDFPNALDLFVCGDNVRKASAINMARLGEALARELTQPESQPGPQRSRR